LKSDVFDLELIKTASFFKIICLHYIYRAFSRRDFCSLLKTRMTRLGHSFSKALKKLNRRRLTACEFFVLFFNHPKCRLEGLISEVRRTYIITMR
jgi:hypothetical protein